MTPIDHIQKLVDANNVDELKNLAATQGLKIHHRMKNAQKIAQAIIDKIAEPPKHDLRHPAEKNNPKPIRINTEEEVREVCKRFFDKPGFIAIFNDDDTWHFKCKGAEDSGHMSVPLRVILWKAESVARGANAPRMVKIDGETMMSA